MYDQDRIYYKLLYRGAYLYRRERKKGSTSSAGTGTTKRVRHGFSDDGSSSSTQPDGMYPIILKNTSCTCYKFLLLYSSIQSMFQSWSIEKSAANTNSKYFR